MAELWMDIPGYLGFYKVSSLGRIFSVINAKIIAPVKAGSGLYYAVNLCKNAKRRQHRINRLVLESFCGKSKLHAAHLNGNRLDNRLENLKWATASDNCKMKHRHGTALFGEKHPMRKLTKKDVLEIVRQVELKEKTPARIARDFKTTPGNIWFIMSGRTWQSVTGKKFPAT